MLCRGDSIGVFQVESRAQINMLPRLRPREFYDLVIEVAIVRPGPIQGDMVHPYLRRRQGLETAGPAVTRARMRSADELQQVLGRTLGVPLFQEQAMRIAIDAAKFTPEEANQLRRSMATFRNAGTIHRFFEKMVDGMTARGYTQDFAERCFHQIEGFGTYGFPGKPRRQLRSAGLCLGLAEMPSSGGVRLRAAELAADGVLCAGADRARCARAWRGGARHRCGRQRVGLHAGRRARCGSGSGLISGFSQEWAERLMEARGEMKREMLCFREGMESDVCVFATGARRACRVPRSCCWRKRMRCAA